MIFSEDENGTSKAEFTDIAGGYCAVYGCAAGTETNGCLMLGLVKLRLLAHSRKTGHMIDLPAPDVGIVGHPDPEDISIMSGAPIAIDRDTAAELIPILQYYVTHGTMPPVDAADEAAEVNGAH